MPASRSLALWGLGLWFGLLVTSWLMAGANFNTVDRVLGPTRRPELDRALSGVEPDARRSALRHLASEVNRWMFRRFMLIQLALGTVTLGLLWSGAGRGRWFVTAALAVAVLQAAFLAGAIVELGRSVDFVPRPLPPELSHRFGLLHASYVLSDFAKAGLILIAAWLTARRL